jgi:hypothetical protein
VEQAQNILSEAKNDAIDQKSSAHIQSESTARECVGIAKDFVTDITPAEEIQE